uniref:Uncharacterized protein n=2 Tax=Brassica oleracea TaxID=3712 RepID=A0A0D3AYI1_BRAOL|nr:unnamed protein product [Brassica oleracea]
MADEFIILRQETLQVLYRLRDASLHSLRGYANDPNITVERLNEIMMYVTVLRNGINDPMGIWDQAQLAPVEAAVEVPPGNNSPAVTVSTEEEEEEE